MLHNIGEMRTEIFDNFDMWNFVKEKKAEGKIRHWGFSFHSTAEELDKILTEHPDAEFVQLQLNYADWENPAIQSRGIYEVARKHGKPIIVMEPLKGDLLADPPESVAKILKEAEPNLSVASWGIRFAADLEGVMVVLSGMSDVAQMEDNLSYMKGFTALTGEEREYIERARRILEETPMIPCTICNYCAKVCPMDIAISGSFTAKNVFTLYGDMAAAKRDEEWSSDGHGKKHAVECIQCGACEDACPQHIEIRKELADIAELFEQKKAD